MKFKSIYIVAIALVVMASASCKKDLLKENTRPTTVGPDQYNPNFSLTSVQFYYTGASMGTDSWPTEWGGIAGYIQHVASTNTSYYYGDKYLLSTGNNGVYFSIAYSTQVQPVVDLIHLTAGKPEVNNLHQMGRIMRALVFQRLTDMYGDVPYSQAGLGYYSRIYTPVYDQQENIYNDMLKEVSEAVDSLNTNGDVATGDMFYYNPSVTAAVQVAEWKKFGNSLLLRLAMRLSKVKPDLAKSWAAKALAGGLMTSNDDNAIVQHTNTQQLNWNKDAWGIISEDSTDLKLCKTFIDTLKNNDDPRIGVYSWIFPTKDNKLADQIGLPPGFIQGGLDPTIDITKQPGYPAAGLSYYSRINDDILNNAAPNLIITYAQTEFLLAEAAQRGWVSGDAATFYKTGIEAAFTQLAVYNPIVIPTVTMADDYVTAHPYKPSKGLSQINTQYWICCLMDEYEAWANWRRTSTGDLKTGQPSGYPSLVPTNYKANITGGTIPRRLQYPADQQFSNSVNYKAAVSRLKGGDGQTQRVWWDVTTGSN